MTSFISFKKWTVLKNQASILPLESNMSGKISDSVPKHWKTEYLGQWNFNKLLRDPAIVGPTKENIQSLFPAPWKILRKPCYVTKFYRKPRAPYAQLEQTKYDRGKIYGCLPFLSFPTNHESFHKAIISQFGLISKVDYFASYWTHLLLW